MLIFHVSLTILSLLNVCIVFMPIVCNDFAGVNSSRFHLQRILYNEIQEVITCTVLINQTNKHVLYNGLSSVKS